MKQLLTFSFLLITSVKIFGQLEFKNSNNGRLMNFEDLNGHSLLKKYDPDVLGSPFFNEDWASAKLTLSKGKEIGPLLVKLNLENNELYYKDSNGKEMIVTDGIIKRIEFLGYTVKEPDHNIFKNGYQPVDKQNKNFYYQVLAEGKVELLVKKSKQIETDKNVLSGEIKKQFSELAPIFYVYINDTIQAFRPNKSTVVNLLKDKEQAIDNFITSNNINCKKTPDLIKVFRYYNNL